MTQSLYSCYLHIIFSTKGRAPWFHEKGFREEVFAYLVRSIEDHDCKSIAVGGYIDHVHLLVRMGKMVLVTNLIKQIKGGSSKWIKERGIQDFYWQAGYGAFSICASQVEMIKNYIKNQEHHHQTQSFQDEFRNELISNNVSYDEKYLWE